jgi:hypothetical protein
LGCGFGAAEAGKSRELVQPMRTESLSITLRKRTPWEASDLGIALVREYAASIWLAWASLVLPVALVIGALCQYFDYFSIAALLLWWLKPVFDRIPLFVLSRAVFGSVPSLRDTLIAQRSINDIGPLFALLTWRRLHPMRALLLPVDFLERLRGAPRALRTALLARAQGSPSSLLTFVCVNMESMLVISVLMLALLFLPTELFSDAMKDTLKNLFIDPPPWAQWAAYLAYTVALSIMEPFYVGAGFGLYLNRRMELEAWDIDLSFRQLAARLQAGLGAARQGAKSLLGIAVLCGAVNLASSHCAWAAGAEKPIANNAAEDGQAYDSDADEQVDEQAADTAPEAQAASAEMSLELNLDHFFVPPHHDFDTAIKKALSDPELNPKATITEWQEKNRSQVRKPDKSAELEYSGGIGNAFSFLLQNALWIVLTVAIVLVAPYILRMFSAREAKSKAQRQAAEPTQLDVDMPEHLPPDLAASVAQLWQQGKPRAALALLYRAGVLRLCDRLGQPLPKGATESQCLRLARDLVASDQHRALFPALVRAWQGIAYASVEPSWAQVQDLLTAWQADTANAGYASQPRKANPSA